MDKIILIINIILVLLFNVFFFCFLFLVDDNGNQESKRVHVQNLFRIVSYCENKADCRRTLQLNYFGETFDDNKCISNKETACDNCRNKVIIYFKLNLFNNSFFYCILIGYI